MESGSGPDDDGSGVASTVPGFTTTLPDDGGSGDGGSGDGGSGDGGSGDGGSGEPSTTVPAPTTTTTAAAQAPRVVGYALNLNRARMSFRFSEPVDPSVDMTKVSLFAVRRRPGA